MGLRIRFPELAEEVPPRPGACDRCGRGPLYRHKRYRQEVKDLQVKEIEVWQYRCRNCGRVTMPRPEGIEKSKQQSQRTKVASVVLYALGLSYRNTADFLEALGVSVHPMTIWRNVQEAGEKVETARAKHMGRHIQLKVLGADETTFKVRGQGLTVGFVVDPLHGGKILGIEVLGDQDSKAFIDWLRPYVETYQAEVVVTDELDQYGAVAEGLGKEHQLCLAHVRKSLKNRLRKIEGYEQDKGIIEESVKELTKEAKRALKRVHKTFRQAPAPLKGEHESAEYKLRMLTLDVLEKWDKLTLHQKTTKPDKGIRRDQPRGYKVPSTNNATERAIGLGGKIRYKLMRGYKSKVSLVKTSWVITLLAGLAAGVSLDAIF